MEDPPEVVDVQLRLDVLLAVESDERGFVSLPDEVDGVADLLQGPELPAPVGADVPRVAVLSGDGRLAEVVLVDPLGLAVELVGAFRNCGHRRIPELHPFWDVRVPDLVVAVGIVALLELVRFELVEDGLDDALLLRTLASPTLTFLVVLVFEVTLVFLSVKIFYYGKPIKMLSIINYI